MKKEKICTVKQRQEFIEWLSDHAEILAGWHNENSERSAKVKDLNNKIAENYTEQIELCEEMLIALLMAEEFNKKEAVNLIQKLLKLSREICESYKKESSVARKQLDELYESILLSLFFMSRDGFDRDTFIDVCDSKSDKAEEREATKNKEEV